MIKQLCWRTSRYKCDEDSAIKLLFYAYAGLSSLNSVKNLITTKKDTNMEKKNKMEKVLAILTLLIEKSLIKDYRLRTYTGTEERLDLQIKVNKEESFTILSWNPANNPNAAWKKGSEELNDYVLKLTQIIEEGAEVGGRKPKAPPIASFCKYVQLIYEFNTKCIRDYPRGLILASTIIQGPKGVQNTMLSCVKYHPPQKKEEKQFSEKTSKYNQVMFDEVQLVLIQNSTRPELKDEAAEVYFYYEEHPEIPLYEDVPYEFLPIVIVFLQNLYPEKVKVSDNLNDKMFQA